MADETTQVQDENVVTDTYHVPGAPYEDPEAAEAVQELQEAEAAVDAEKPDRPYVALDSRTPELAYATRDNIVHPGPVGAAIAAQAEAVRISEDVFNVSSLLRVDLDPAMLVLLSDEVQEPEVDHEELREEFDAQAEELVEATRENEREPEPDTDEE